MHRSAHPLCPSLACAPLRLTHRFSLPSCAYPFLPPHRDGVSPPSAIRPSSSQSPKGSHSLLFAQGSWMTTMMGTAPDREGPTGCCACPKASSETDASHVCPFIVNTVFGGHIRGGGGAIRDRSHGRYHVLYGAHRRIPQRNIPPRKSIPKSSTSCRRHCSPNVTRPAAFVTGVPVTARVSLPCTITMFPAS